jgi:hypothetical protein
MHLIVHQTRQKEGPMTLHLMIRNRPAIRGGDGPNSVIADQNIDQTQFTSFTICTSRIETVSIV